MNSTPPEAPSGPEPGPAPGSDQAGTQDGPRVTRDQVRNVSQIRRTVYADRKLAGVAGGLARHLDVDPVILRVGFVILAFFGGAGVLLYGALWLLLPEEGSDKATINLDERSLLVAILGVAVLAGLLLAGDSWGGLWFSWPLAVVGLIALVVIASRNSGNRPPTPYATPYSPPPGTPGTPLAQPYAGPPTPPYAGTPATPYAAPAAGATAPYPYPTSPPAAGGPGESGWVPPVPPAGGPPPAYTPPAPVYRPRDPRKHGPILFWFTLALVTLGLGILGMFDVAGSDVAPSAYPALATAIIAVMLLVGAFYGRAGGLILLGLLASVGLVGSTVGQHIDETPRTARPVTAGAVADRYSHGAGEIVVDLTAIQNLEALDGRTIRVESGAGRIEVIVPENVDVLADTSLGAGNAEVFDESRDGAGIEFQTQHNAIDEVATINLDVQLGVGEIDVRTAAPVPALEEN